MSIVEADLLRHASALHDVGKVGIPDEILLKPAKLDPAEWAKMKTHTTIGASILSGLEVGARADGREDRAAATTSAGTAPATRTGLKGEEIPLAARICAVCDVFDALLSPRPTRTPGRSRDVVRELAGLRGTHLDPALVDAFLPLAADLYEECFAPLEPPPRRTPPPSQAFRA